jgi:hypothetical protein
MVFEELVIQHSLRQELPDVPRERKIAFLCSTPGNQRAPPQPVVLAERLGPRPALPALEHRYCVVAGGGAAGPGAGAGAGADAVARGGSAFGTAGDGDAVGGGIVVFGRGGASLGEGGGNFTPGWDTVAVGRATWEAFVGTFVRDCLSVGSMRAGTVTDLSASAVEVRRQPGVSSL